MEGMVSKELIKIQTTYYETHGGKYTPTSWVRQLVIQLLEITHGQWLYRNVQVHDNVSGIVVTERKQKIPGGDRNTNSTRRRRTSGGR